ncbi:MAG: lipase family protein [Gordonia sp. (in: high G+C Gram-positive bacteria)]|uniref:lipase family protein n=1 Tax=Gordonia sp. (in: high G+C Gram-positive bacteria) TaxID=84139 RepID=UPI0039E65572
MKFRFSVAAAVGAAAALIVGLTAPVAQATPKQPIKVAPAQAVPAPQELDPSFYEPARRTYVNKQPGEILAARRIIPATFGVMPMNVDAWQLSYRSTNSRGEPIAAVTTLLKPRGRATGPRKLVSMQMAEDSLAGYCATSYAVQQGSAAALAGQIGVPGEMSIVQDMLDQGWAVSLPDHQGPKHAYAAGPLGARITLDGLRAAKRFAPFGIDDASPIAMYGYSGGAIVTGHAAELRKTYAPELNIVGAAEGGVPADLKVVLNTAQNNATSGLVLAAVFGVAREYPYFQRFLDQHLECRWQGPAGGQGATVCGVATGGTAVPQHHGVAAVAGRPGEGSPGKATAGRDADGQVGP